MAGFTWTSIGGSTSWISALRWDMHGYASLSWGTNLLAAQLGRCWKTCSTFCRTSWMKGRSTGQRWNLFIFIPPCWSPVGCGPLYSYSIVGTSTVTSKTFGVFLFYICFLSFPLFVDSSTLLMLYFWEWIWRTRGFCSNYLGLSR